MRKIAVLVAATLVAGGSALAIAASDKETGRIGPKLSLYGNGRRLHPAGKLTELGNLPVGGALTPNGRYYWAVSAGRGFNDVRIVNVRTGKPGQVIRLPGTSGGIAFAPDGRRAYVSGVPDSDHKDQKVGGKGAEGDVIHVFEVGAKGGSAKELEPIPVPPPSDAPTEQNFPPSTGKASWPMGVAVSPDGKRLAVALNLADRAALIDLPGGSVKYTTVGAYPHGAAITRDGKTGLITNEGAGTVSAIDLASGEVKETITVGPHLSHPEGIVVDPKRPLAYVTLANADQVAVIDLAKLSVERMITVAEPGDLGQGVAPVDLALTPDGSRLLVADAGEDALAVIRLPAGAGIGLRQKGAPSGSDWKVVGRIPTGAYPTAVAVSRLGLKAKKKRSPRAHHSAGKRKKAKATPTLIWVAAKGLGVGPNPKGPDTYKISDDNAQSFDYLPERVYGDLGRLPLPNKRETSRLTAFAARALVPSNSKAAPADTPIRGAGGGASDKIKYVFYVVKENRTYDQVFGDDPRGDGDPSLAVFGEKLTPNHHALARRFGLLDHVYADSEASIDGHYWTAAAYTPDYVTRSWHQNYAGRGRPYDFGAYVVAYPPTGFLVDQATRQGISWFSYGEAINGISPLPDRQRTSEEEAEATQRYAKTDVGELSAAGGCYPGDTAIGQDVSGALTFDSSLPPGAPPGAESRADCFKNKFQLQLLTNSVPHFNELVLPSDHTNGGKAGKRTVPAFIADNDYGLGQIVDTISHSKIWKESAIIVVEDDSQDGPDHVDAHRMPALVISPYAKRGAVVHERYDQLSAIRTIEMILGMKPLYLYDSLAVPMYEAFQATPDNEPYAAIVPQQDRLAKNPSGTAAARMSRGLNLTTPDRVPQRKLARIIWKSMFGDHAQPPPPGPNNTPGG